MTLWQPWTDWRAARRSAQTSCCTDGGRSSAGASARWLSPRGPDPAAFPADDVQRDKSFVDDLDVDSLSMVEIVVAAEEKFGVRIPDDQVKNLRTVGDAVDYIDTAQA